MGHRQLVMDKCSHNQLHIVETHQVKWDMDNNHSKLLHNKTQSVVANTHSAKELILGSIQAHTQEPLQ